MKECPNKGKTPRSESTSSSTKKCEHYGLEGLDIYHHYSLHLNLCLTKYTNKDGKSKKYMKEATILNLRAIGQRSNFK